jgi:hypothetical protein
VIIIISSTASPKVMINLLLGIFRVDYRVVLHSLCQST